jgi:hypothetical protein
MRLIGGSDVQPTRQLVPRLSVVPTVKGSLLCWFFFFVFNVHSCQRHSRVVHGTRHKDDDVSLTSSQLVFYRFL